MLSRLLGLIFLSVGAVRSPVNGRAVVLGLASASDFWDQHHDLLWLSSYLTAASSITAASSREALVR